MKKILKIESVPVSRLKFDPRNARRHSDRNLKAIADSLSRFGQMKPIVVDGHGVVRAGNGTLQAAISLGWKEVQVVRSDHSEKELRAYSIMDNRTGELAEWDAATLEELVSSGELGDVGFEDAELARLCDIQIAEDGSIVDIGSAGSGGNGFGTQGDGVALEPHEHYDYIVILASDSSTWNVLCEKLGISPLPMKHRKGGKASRLGICRAIRAENVLELLSNNHSEQKAS